MSKTIHVSGKRKRAIARATIKAGSGKVRINKVMLDVIEPAMIKLKLQEPLILAGKLSSQVDVDINVFGGGVSSQAEAVRLVLGRGLVEYSKDDRLKKKFLEYDRHLLVADVRRKEVCKPNDSKARAKRQKSYR